MPAERERLREVNERRRGEVEGVGSGGEPPEGRAHRPVPDQVDQVVTVRLAAGCPDGGGALALERVAVQDVQDRPPPLRW